MKASVDKRDRIIVKEKIKGKSESEIGRIVYPNQTPKSAQVSVTRRLNKPSVAHYYEQSKLQALKELNITWKRIIQPINDGLEFDNGNGVQSSNIRLKAAKMAIELLQSRDMSDEIKPQNIKLPNEVDEIEMQRLLFRKKG